MSHHGPNPFDGDRDNDAEAMKALQARQQVMRDLLNTTGFRGAVGSFPDGRLTKQDEGLIQFAVGDQDGRVVLDFGTPTAWIGMTAQQAMDLASDLMKRARLVARKNGETVAVTIGGAL